VTYLVVNATEVVLDAGGTNVDAESFKRDVTLTDEEALALIATEGVLVGSEITTMDGRVQDEFYVATSHESA
jgi:hypothetical protein